MKNYQNQEAIVSLENKIDGRGELHLDSVATFALMKWIKTVIEINDAQKEILFNMGIMDVTVEVRDEK